MRPLLPIRSNAVTLLMQERALHTGWRRARDSNPRYPFRYAGFQDRSHQPLGQLSILLIRQKNPISSPGLCSAMSISTAFSTSA